MKFTESKEFEVSENQDDVISCSTDFHASGSGRASSAGTVWMRCAIHPLGWALALLSVTFGIISLSGTWLGRVLSERQRLVGSLVVDGSASGQIQQYFREAWRVEALVQGAVSLGSVLCAAASVTLLAILPELRKSERLKLAVAIGFILGGLGLYIACGVYFGAIADISKTFPGRPAP